MVEERGTASSFEVSSFATSDWEEGNFVYPPAQKALQAHGITGFSHRSQVLKIQHIINSDYVLVMDNMNMLDVVRMTAGRYGDKIFKLGYFLKPAIDIADPYYTGNFERSFREINAACAAFLDYLSHKHSLVLSYDRLH